VAFEIKTKTYIKKYVEEHLKVDNYAQLLIFIENEELKDEIIKELYSIRYVYKILEGLQVKDNLQVIQSKIQILSYSSIYEAIIDYLLFEKFSNTNEVQQLLKKTSYKTISLPKKCDDCKFHDNKNILFMFKKEEQRETKEIKFIEKINTLFSIIDFNIYRNDGKGAKKLIVSSIELKEFVIISRTQN